MTAIFSSRYDLRSVSAYRGYKWYKAPIQIARRMKCYRKFSFRSWLYRRWLKKNITARPPDPHNIDVFFISYPKSGRTWLRFLIGKALALQYQVDERFIPETYHLTEMLDVPTMQFVHNGADAHKANRYKYGALPKDQEKFAQNQIVFLIRDPRDILVSAYFWATVHTRLYEGEIGGFIRSDEHGIRKIVEFYNIWHQNRHVPRSFYLVSYEALQRAPYETLADLFQHLAIVIEPAYLEEAISFSEFANMRRWEKQGKSRFLMPGNPQEPQSYKTRRGQIGGYRDILSTEDLAFIDTVIREMGCPFLEDPWLAKTHDYLISV